MRGNTRRSPTGSEKVGWILPPVPDPPATGRSAAEVRARYGIAGPAGDPLPRPFRRGEGPARAPRRRSRRSAAVSRRRRFCSRARQEACRAKRSGTVAPLRRRSGLGRPGARASCPGRDRRPLRGLRRSRPAVDQLHRVLRPGPGRGDAAGRAGRRVGPAGRAPAGPHDRHGRDRAASATRPISRARLLEVLESPGAVPAPPSPRSGRIFPPGADARFEYEERLPLGRGNACDDARPIAPRRILRAHLREMPLHRVIMRTIEARILSEVAVPAADPRHRLRRRALRLGHLSSRARTSAWIRGSPTSRRRCTAASTACCVARRLGRDAVSPTRLLRVGRLQLRVRAHPRHRRDGRRDRPRAAARRDVRVHGHRRALQRIPDDARGLAPPRARAGAPRATSTGSTASPCTSTSTRRRSGRSASSARASRSALALLPLARRPRARSTASHYVSLPHLAARKLTGRWVPVPAADGQRVLGPAARALQPGRPNPRPARASRSCAPGAPILL